MREHFELALCGLKLPVPDDYPWEILFDPQERVLQVNQCVPALRDVSVVRSDSRRAPAKRDVEAVLRRYVPAVALQIAQHVGRSDIQGDVDRIAVNCWSRFFDPASGKLKDAFVAALTVQKPDILDCDLQRADALEAFRSLRGASFTIPLTWCLLSQPFGSIRKTTDLLLAEMYLTVWLRGRT